MARAGYPGATGPRAPARAVALHETFLAGAFQKAEEVDGSSGDFGTFVGTLFCGWVEASQAAGADPEATARRLVQWIDEDPWGFCYRIEHELVKVLDKLATREIDRLADRLREARDGPPPGSPTAPAASPSLSRGDGSVGEDVELGHRLEGQLPQQLIVVGM